MSKYSLELQRGHYNGSYTTWKVLPKSKMAFSDNDRFAFEIVHVLHFRNGLNEELQQSVGKVWLEILVAKLATNFQDLVAKVKNLVVLAPVLGAILCPVQRDLMWCYSLQESTLCLWMFVVPLSSDLCWSVLRMYSKRSCHILKLGFMK